MSACDGVIRRLRAVRRGDVDERASVDAPGDTGAHLAACSSCRDTAALLSLLDVADGRDDADAAWARVARRLGDAPPPDTVVLRRPPLGWRVVLAAAAGIGSLLLVPEPLQVLAALGFL